MPSMIFLNRCLMNRIRYYTHKKKTKIIKKMKLYVIAQVYCSVLVYQRFDI